MGWEGMIFAVGFIAIAVFVIFGMATGRFRSPLRRPDREAEHRAAQRTLNRWEDKKQGHRTGGRRAG